jgi:hypothetical protein
MTIGAVQIKAQAAAAAEVQAFMHRHGLAAIDLINVGGVELKSPNLKTCEKARRVEKCWALMARLSVRHAYLEAAPAYTSTKLARRRRGEGVFLQVTEIAGVSDIPGALVKSNEINNLTNSTSVASPDPNRVANRAAIAALRNGAR